VMIALHQNDKRETTTRNDEVIVTNA